ILDEVKAAMWSTQSTLVVSMARPDSMDRGLVNDACAILVEYEELRYSRLQLEPPPGSEVPVRWRQCQYALATGRNENGRRVAAAPVPFQPRRLPVHAAHQGGEGDLFVGRALVLERLAVALGRRGVREHLEGGIHDHL